MDDKTCLHIYCPYQILTIVLKQRKTINRYQISLKEPYLSTPSSKDLPTGCGSIGARWVTLHVSKRTRNRQPYGQAVINRLKQLPQANCFLCYTMKLQASKLSNTKYGF